MNLMSLIAAGTYGEWFHKTAKWLLNFDYDKIEAGDRVEFSFLGMPQRWGMLAMVVCVLALVWLVFWLYRREGKTASAKKKFFLAVVRTVVVLLALLMFLEPTLVISKLRETFSPVVVLVDASESMTIEDLYAEQADVAGVAAVTDRPVSQVLNSRMVRQDLVTGALNNPKLDFLNRLAEKNPVELYTFSVKPDKLSEIGGAGSEPSKKGSAAPESNAFKPGDFKFSVSGGRTYLGRAVTSILENAASAGSSGLAGIVVMSDGQDNDPDLDATALAGKYASREGVPVFAVPTGLSKSRKTKNIKLEKSLQANRTLFIGDPAEFVALVSSSGYPNKTVKAELCRRKVASQEDEVLASKEVIIAANASGQSVALTHTPKEGDGGEYVYSIRVVPLEDEHLKRDNVAMASGVRVVKTTTNVLIIAGSPTWEFRFLKPLLIRDKTVTLSCWIQSASKAFPQVGNRLLSRMPRSSSEILDEKDGYHVIILMDVDPADLDMEWFKMLNDFVDKKAGGLLVVAGEKYSWDLFNSPMSAPLRKMLPVEIDMNRARMTIGASPKGAKPWPLKPTEDGLQSPLLKFSAEREVTEKIWKSLPGSIWSFPVAKAKHGATVLMRTMDPKRYIGSGGNPEPMPVLVTGFYGSGRVGFMAFDECWRWRSLGLRVYDTFWTQCIRALVEGRMLGGKKSVVLETDSETYPLGTPVTVSAKVFDAAGKAANLPGVTVRVEMSSGAAENGGGGAKPPESVKATLTLAPVPGAPGTYKRQYTPPRTGYYKLEMEGGEPGGSAATANFEVASQFEFDRPEANRVRLAELTDPSLGGGVVELAALDRLPDSIASRKKQTIEPGDQFSLWANPLVLGLMVTLLGIELVVRKRSNMA